MAVLVGAAFVLGGVSETGKKQTNPASLANLRESQKPIHGVYEITVGQAETQALAGRIMAVLVGAAFVLGG